MIHSELATDSSSSAAASVRCDGCGRREHTVADPDAPAVDDGPPLLLLRDGWRYLPYRHQPLVACGARCASSLLQSLRTLT